MTVLTVVVLALGLALLGDRLLPPEEPTVEGPEEIRWVLSLLAGVSVLFLLCLLLDGLGLAWSRWSLTLPLLGGLVLAAWLRPRTLPALGRLDPDWGDLVAVAALAPVALFALRGWTLAPDFVFHWGTKAHRFFLAGGIDWEYLAAGYNPALHPDYPNLVPTLWAVTGTLRGLFRYTTGTVWSVVWAAALVVLGRGWLRRDLRVPALRPWGTGVLALLVAFVAVAFRRAGDADWHLSVAVLAGAVLLTGPLGRRTDLAVGVVAAFAAASKIEGLPFALFLIGIHLLARRRHPLRAGVLLRSLGPGTCLILPWMTGVLHHDLFQASNLGPLRPEQISRVALALGESLGAPEWRGIGLLLLVLLPLPFLLRRLRRPGLLVVLQLAFYLLAYVASPLDPRPLVLTTFFRLIAHVAPTLLLCGILLLDAWISRHPEVGSE